MRVWWISPYNTLYSKGKDAEEEEEEEKEEEGEQRVREPPATTGISLSLLFFTDNADAGHFYDDQAGGNHIPDKRL